MIIQQQKQEFQPITITLLTQEEASAFWGMCAIVMGAPAGNGESRALAKEFDQWFRSKDQLKEYTT